MTFSDLAKYSTKLIAATAELLVMIYIVNSHLFSQSMAELS